MGGDSEADMVKLYGWKARRSGGRITVTHSAGKVSNVDTIELRGGGVIATAADGSEYRLMI